MVQIVTAFLVLIAAWFDFRTGRIPNRLQIIALFFVAGMIGIFDPYSWSHRLFIGFSLSLICFLLALLGHAGGGDFKMMAWVGAGLGIEAVVVFLLAVGFMGVVATGMYLFKRSVSWQPLAPYLLVGLILSEIGRYVWGIERIIG